MKRVLIFVCDVWCTSESPLPVGEGEWSMCNTWCMAFNSSRTDVGHLACPVQMMRGMQTYSAANIARELDIHW